MDKKRRHEYSGQTQRATNLLAKRLSAASALSDRYSSVQRLFLGPYPSLSAVQDTKLRQPNSQASACQCADSTCAAESFTKVRYHIHCDSHLGSFHLCSVPPPDILVMASQICKDHLQSAKIRCDTYWLSTEQAVVHATLFCCRLLVDVYLGNNLLFLFSIP